MAKYSGMEGGGEGEVEIGELAGGTPWRHRPARDDTERLADGGCEVRATARAQGGSAGDPVGHVTAIQVRDALHLEAVHPACRAG